SSSVRGPADRIGVRDATRAPFGGLIGLAAYGAVLNVMLSVGGLPPWADENVFQLPTSVSSALSWIPCTAREPLTQSCTVGPISRGCVQAPGQFWFVTTASRLEE